MTILTSHTPNPGDSTFSTNGGQVKKKKKKKINATSLFFPIFAIRLLGSAFRSVERPALTFRARLPCTVDLPGFLKHESPSKEYLSADSHF